MKESPFYDISEAEARETFGVKHDGPHCEECGEPTTEHGTCPECVEVMRELEADDVWRVWLAGLKHKADQARMEAISDSLAGWQYVDADRQFERTSKGVSLASANNLQFLAPRGLGCLFFTNLRGLPLVTIHCCKDLKYPDWTATFTASTPHEIILAACNAVIHQ